MATSTLAAKWLPGFLMYVSLVKFILLVDKLKKHMADNKQNVTVSFPISGLLTVAFVVLKLCHVIDWSWWWVLAPVWIPVAIVLVIAIIAGLMVK